MGAEKAQRAYLLPGAPEPEPGELERLFVLLQAGEHREAHEVRKEAAGYDLDLSLSVDEARAALHQDRDPTTIKARHNLPAQPTRFVSREAEKTKLGALLGDPECRLLTIMGPGGFGKTRLAIEVAQEQLGSFPDGVFLVPLAPVSSPTSMPSEIINALGIQPTGEQDATEQLFSYLENKTLLLVLDNLEHLLDGADLIHDLWERTQHVKLLVTSRERLNLRAEQVFILSGLSSPENVAVEESDAARLFLQTARTAGHEAVLSEESTPSIVRICQMVGGMPLAIELAASWLNALTVEDVVTEISRGIDVLRSSTPDRHRSIRVVFESSWELLPDSEREILRRLSVFRGGFKRDAAMVVAGASLFSLGGLVDKSFLSLTNGGRYEQHPLVLEFARERLAENLAEQADAVEKHGLYYLSFLQEHAPELSSSNIKQARRPLDAELPNILAAWEWAFDNLKLERIKASAFPLHQVLADQEAIKLFARAADRLDEANPEHHAALGYMLIGQGSGSVFRAVRDFARSARSLLTRGLALLRPLGEDLGVAWALSRPMSLVDSPDDTAQALALHQEGFQIARRIGNPHLLGWYLALRPTLEAEGTGRSVEDIEKLHEQTLREQRDVGDPFYLNWSLAKFGEFLLNHQSFDEGKALLTESLEMAREIGGSVVSPLATLAEAALASGELEEVEALASELLQVTRGQGLTGMEAVALARLGVFEARRGNLAEVEAILVNALGTARESRHPRVILVVLVGMSELRIAHGHVAGAAEWLSFALHHRYTADFDRAEAQRLLDGLRGQLPPEELAAALSRGKERNMDDVMSELLSAF